MFHLNLAPYKFHYLLTQAYLTDNTGPLNYIEYPLTIIVRLIICCVGDAAEAADSTGVYQNDDGMLMFAQ